MCRMAWPGPPRGWEWGPKAARGCRMVAMRSSEVTRGSGGGKAAGRRYPVKAAMVPSSVWARQRFTRAGDQWSAGTVPQGKPGDLCATQASGTAGNQQPGCGRVS